MTAVRLEHSGPVARIILDRPDKMNALNAASLAELEDAYRATEENPDIRCAVIYGEGPAFCAGADLDLINSLSGKVDAWADFLDSWHRVYNSIAACSKPTIAAVHGYALAGGFELLLVQDLVVAAEDSVIGDYHARYGLFPGGGSTQRLPRLIGQRRALWLLLSGEQLAMNDALAWGLVNDVVPSGRVLERAFEMAELLSRRSASTTEAIKRAVTLGQHHNLIDALNAERPIAVSHIQSIDAQAGLSAFNRGAPPPDFGPN